MYDLLKREDIDWRAFNYQVAKEIHTRHKVSDSALNVFVLDDSIKTRRGKKMEGVSRHFDPASGKPVMGHQVLILGLATEEVFMPLDWQRFISQSKAQALNHPHQAGSVAQARYVEASTHDKLSMAQAMMARAIANGVQAQSLVADAWFGSKRMIDMAFSLGVCAILRMNKGKLKYRAVSDKGKKVEWGAKALYAQAVRGQWRKVQG
ncbi:MAG: hypothetical protein GKR94_01555 [Gammaproteobacteria bacterium]|nr:hypothetical protein [Gammaproteobacteria bacterium]